MALGSFHLSLRGYHVPHQVLAAAPPGSPLHGARVHLLGGPDWLGRMVGRVRPPITILNSSELYRFIAGRSRSVTWYGLFWGPGTMSWLWIYFAMVRLFCPLANNRRSLSLQPPTRTRPLLNPQPASRAKRLSSRSCPQPQRSAPTPTTTWCTTASTQPPTITSTSPCTACCRGCRCCGCCPGHRPVHGPQLVRPRGASGDN